MFHGKCTGCRWRAIVWPTAKRVRLIRTYCSGFYGFTEKSTSRASVRRTNSFFPHFVLHPVRWKACRWRVTQRNATSRGKGLAWTANFSGWCPSRRYRARLLPFCRGDASLRTFLSAPGLSGVTRCPNRGGNQSAVDRSYISSRLICVSRAGARAVI